MINIVNSNNQILIIDHLPASNYTKVGCSKDDKKYYYRIDNSSFPFTERIKKLAFIVFKIIVTCGLAFVFSDSLRLQWREALWNRKEIVIVSPQSLKKFHFENHYNLAGLKRLFNIIEMDKIAVNEQQLELFLNQSSAERLAKIPLLDLNFKKFESLPSNIGNLINLKKLLLYGNKLQRLTPAIGDLTHLEILNLASNQLVSLPTSVEKLTNLKDLSLISNKIEFLPTNIGNLSNLKTLHLNFNQLDSLPDSIGNLSKLESLDLRGNLLDSLPDNIKNLSNLKYLVLDNNQFQVIPDCLYHLPRTCNIDFNYNDIDQQTREKLERRIQNNNYQGPRFTFSKDDYLLPDDEATKELKASLNEWSEVDLQSPWLRRLSFLQKNSLSSWLNRLKEVADYKYHEVIFKGKVKQFLEWLAKETVKTNLAVAYHIITEATDTCGDKVALSFNTLSIHVKLCESDRLSLIELKDLIIGLERLDRLHKIAEQKCNQAQRIDPIETYLFYETKLKDKLKLPIESQSLLYENLAQVSESDIEQTKVQILNETGLDKQVSLLLQHPHWKNALAKSPDFEAMKKTCEAQKQKELDQIDLLDESALLNYHSEFKKNDETIWDPYYLLTKPLIDSQ